MYSTPGPYVNHSGSGRQMVSYQTNNAYANQVPMEPPTLCYQVDFNAVAVGKVVAMSKRRIRWRFGFPNQESLNAGKSGIDCRGEEHDVHLVWSVTSGKQMLMSNGQHLHTGMNKGRIFEHSWHDKNGTHLKVIAHATAPVSNNSGTRQYDLLINGKSFFTMPKVYEIGLKRTNLADNRIPGVITNSQRNILEQSSPLRASLEYTNSGRGLVAPASAEQEEDDLKRAIEESLKESRAHLSMRGRLDEQSIAASTLTNTITEQHSIQNEQPLIDLLGESTPIPSTNSQALVPVAGAPSHYQLNDPFAYQPQPQFGAPAPAPAAMTIPFQDEFAPQAPSYNDISSQIMMGYSPSGMTNPGPHSPNLENAPSNPFDDPPADHTSTNPFDTAAGAAPAYGLPPGNNPFEQPQVQPPQYQQNNVYGGNNAYAQQQQPHQNTHFQQQNYSNC